MRLPQTAVDAIQAEIEALQAQAGELQAILDKNEAPNGGGVTVGKGKSKLTPHQKGKQKKALKEYWAKKKAEKEAANAPPVPAEAASLGEDQFDMPATGPIPDVVPGLPLVPKAIKDAAEAV